MQITPIDFPTGPSMPGEPLSSFKTGAGDAPAQPEKVESRSTSEDLIKLKNSLAEHSISLKFSTDDKTNVVVVQMIDENTGEEIRQFPTEVSLTLAANFIKLQGLFVDKSK
ncbi:MAG TPA: flagellar protein FlaG [Pyrinomonadaceae bacterium]|nr:flagellar protein FlaG [Pyrinomonadaceae bacterium]